MGGVRPPFNMLRACFWLLAILLAVQMFETLAGGFTCFYLFIVKAAELGSCASYGERVTSLWAEMLATVLALLLAARNGKPPEG